MLKKYKFRIKWFFIITVVLIQLTGIGNEAIAQLTGTYTIDNTIPTGSANYHSFTDAINALNVGISGPVVFNVASGETFSELPPVITATGTAINTITFEKSGSGNNPVLSATGTTGTMDGIIILVGTSYISFDGIDLKDAGSAIEWGYALLKKNSSAPVTGCQFVTIKNCNITLNNSNKLSTGIYSNVHTSASLTQLTLTSSSDAANNCVFSNNVIQNSYYGIKLTGYLSGPSAPLLLYDQNNLISGNNISNFGSTSSGTDSVSGIFVKNQNNCGIINNNISNGLSSSALFGILAYGNSSSVSGNFASINISGNNISTLSCAGTGGSAPLIGIYCGVGNKGTNNILNIKNNIVQNSNYTGTTSNIMDGIWTTSTAILINISGNKVYNNSCSTSGIFNCIQADNAYYVNIDSNYISGNSKTSTNVLRGIYTSGSEGTEEVFANIINNLSCLGNIQGIDCSSPSIRNDVYGNVVDSLIVTGTNAVTISAIIQTGYSPAGVRTVHDNTIFGCNIHVDGSNYIYGINCTINAISLNVYNNKVYDLSQDGVGSGLIYGIYTIGAFNLYVYNNIVSDIRASKSNQGATTFPVTGILAYPYYNKSSYAGIFYNTVYLNGSTSGSTFSSACLSVASTYGIIEVKNNNLINMSTAGSGYSAAFRRIFSSSFILTSLKSNGNNFYAGTPGSNNLIYYDDGAGPVSTLAAYKNLVSPNDANTISIRPPFVNIATAPYDLRIQTGATTGLNKAGIPISLPIPVTNDYFGNARNVSFPSIGAHEFIGISNDLVFPIITFNPVPNSTSTSAVTVTATITDQSGVPVSGSGLPVLYWRRNATGSWTAVTGGSIGNNQYSFSFGSGAAVNDSIYYYIVAQDGAGTPNVGAYPIGGASGFSANPPAASTPPASPMIYKIFGGYSGIYHIGTGKDYANLTSAAAAYNSNFMSGPVTFIIDNNYNSSEPYYPVVFLKNAGASSVNTLTIKPQQPGVSITGPLTSQTSSVYTKALLAFWGTSYVTLDGSYNGTNSRDLSLIGDSVTCVLSVGSFGAGKGATNITFKNLNIIGGNNNQYGLTGIVLSDTNLAFNRYIYAGDNNNDITIQNNIISFCRDGITVVADQGGLDSNLIISNNIIGDPNASNSITRRGISIAGASSPVVTGNEIYNMVQNDVTVVLTNKDVVGIDIEQDVNNAIISNNKVHNIHANYMTTAQGAIGIFINGGQYLTTNNCRIFNNFVSDLTSSDLAAASSLNNNTVGIRIYSGSGHQVYFNSVYLSGNQLTYTGTGKVTTAAAFGTDGNYVFNLDIRDNIFVDSLKSQNVNSKLYSVYIASGSVISNIDYNNYYVPAGSGYNVGFFGSDFNSFSGSGGWQGITGQDLHSTNTRVSFISLEDLHLTGSSRGDTRLTGTPISGITNDIDGQLRNTNFPYMGADEDTTATLPVELYSFTSETNGRNNTLSWMTATEKNSYSFILERDHFDGSKPSGKWMAAGEIRAAGNSFSKKEYKFTDKKLETGKYLYRIKSVDEDGTYSYSKTLTAEISVPKEYSISQNYPNPFNPSTKVDYQLPAESKVSLELFNITGERIGEIINKEQAAGYYTVEVGPGLLHRALASGVYFYRIVAIDKTSGNKFINVRKMMMLK